MISDAIVLAVWFDWLCNQIWDDESEQFMTQNAELAASLRQIMKVLEQMAELAKENQSL